MYIWRVRIVHPIFVALCAGAAFTALPQAALAQTPGYHLVGVAPDGENSGVGVVTADGRVAAGTTSSQTNPNATFSPFVWSEASGRYDLWPTERLSRLAAPRGISEDGTVLVGQAGGSAAFLWSGPGIYQVLPRLTVPNQPVHDQNGATGVSGDGAIVVGRSYKTLSLFGEAFRWTQAGGMQPLGFTFPTHVYSEANAISRDGNVIVGMSQDASGQSDAFRWTATGGMQVLPPLPISSATYAFGTNHDGSVIVGAGGGVGTLWTSQGVQALTSPPGWSSRATDTNDDGSVIVGLLFNVSTSSPAIWTPSAGWQTPAVYFAAQGFPVPTGWTVTALNALSADGRTFGGSMDVGGHREGFILTVPAPSTVLFAVSVGLCSAPRRRRT